MPDSPSPPPAAAPADDLAALRAEIDALDDALHDLVMTRAAIVARLAESRAKGGGPALRPGREAVVLRRLLARHQGALPRAALVRLWREIFAVSTAMQGNFAIALFAPEAGHERLAREHFGAATPMRLHPTPARALAAVTAGEATAAVLPLPAEEAEGPDAAWWAHLDALRLHVVARLPFVEQREAPSAFVVGPLPPDASGRDRSLLALETEGEFSRDGLSRMLAGAGLAPQTLLLRREDRVTRALLEVEGFMAAADPRLAALPQLRLQLLGAYAVPEPGDRA